MNEMKKNTAVNPTDILANMHYLIFHLGRRRKSAAKPKMFWYPCPKSRTTACAII